MVEIKLHKNEIEYIRESVICSSFLGNDTDLAKRILGKIEKADGNKTKEK